MNNTLAKKKKLFKIIGIPLISIVAICAALFFTLLYFSSGRIKPTWGGNMGIAEKIFVEIGGIQQGMIIESEDTSNPVLLILHGGPGTTEYAAFKKYEVGLEEFFTVCYWEQRGSGISYHPDIDESTMTLSGLISDTIEVTNYLRGRFEKDKIFVLGHSWGTLLGSHAINQNPELFHAYIGVGQVVDGIRSEREIYEFIRQAATENGDEAVLERLDGLDITKDATFSSGEYLGMRMEYVLKYGGGFTCDIRSMTPFYQLFLTCGAYTIEEKTKIMSGMEFSGRLMAHYVINADLIKELPSQEVPVFIFAGKYDYQTVSSLAQEYFGILDAPTKEFYYFENSAHSPMFEETELFMKIITDEIMPLFND